MSRPPGDTERPAARRGTGEPVHGLGAKQPTASGSEAFPERSREELVHEAIERFATYLRSERENYYGKGQPLGRERLQQMRGYFSGEMLERVRVLELQNQRVANPWFYPMLKATGVQNLPDLQHKASVTFLDVVVFNERFTTRDLFHGLVHTAQVQLFGVEEFSRLFVRGFLRARSYFLVPLKAHAFSLDARFASQAGKPFSVEDEVRSWWQAGRYS